MRVVPDGFTGAVMAIEGVDDASVLLHGQSGCRKGLLISQRASPRADRLFDTDSPVYAGARTVPYSAVNGMDYSGGSAPKLRRALEYVAQEDYRVIAVTCAPGISIVGDDCRRVITDCGLSERAFVLGEEDLGSSAWEGFDRAMMVLLRFLQPRERNVRKGTVTVLGLSIMHKDWHTVVGEVREMLEGMSLEPVCFLGAGCTVEDAVRSFDSEFCLVLDPDYCVRTAGFYRSMGVGIISTGNAFVGFDEVATLISEISSATGKDADFAMKTLNDARRRAYEQVVASGADLSGMSYSVESSPSTVVTLGRWLESSFAMVRSDDPDYLFCDGMSAKMYSASGNRARCVDIGFPSPRVDFVPAPVLGIRGAMYILDSLFNR